MSQDIMLQFVSLYVFKILVNLPNRNLECKRNYKLSERIAPLHKNLFAGE